MIIVAIDASTPICMVVLHNTETQQTDYVWEEGIGIHSERVATGLLELLSKQGLMLHDVTSFLLTSGPGSYTGLRIAGSFYKGLLFGMNKPITAVPTLSFFARSMAESECKPGRIHAILDARRTHVYYQFFEIQDNEPISFSSVEIKSLEEVKGFIQAGDAIGGTGLSRFGTDWLKSQELTIFEGKSVINPVILPRFSTCTDQWSLLCTQTDPERYEPDYFGSPLQIYQKKHTPNP